MGGTDLSRANLSYADLTNSILDGANLTGANLEKTAFYDSMIGGVIFCNNNLSETIGLETIQHMRPSFLDISSLRLSVGRIPEIFLRGCGLSDWEIESAKLYDPDLSTHEIDEILYTMHALRARQPIQSSPVFISYSHADKIFVDKLEALLNEKGIRFWRDIHDATAGRLETQIDRVIRLNSTVLLILSENSIKSDWVQHEVRLARDLEKETGRDVLCPISLDDAWKANPWPQRIIEQVKEYNILDFSLWNDDSKFKMTFDKLVEGLHLYYKKE